jgi:5-hydroxyisourate hydrolase
MPGSLTTAVIDGLRGEPASGMLVDLFCLPRGLGERQHLKTIETGTAEVTLIEGEALVAATYELVFHVGRYFKAQPPRPADAPFLDVIPVRFAIADPARASRLALLVSPWTYTVYRG